TPLQTAAERDEAGIGGHCECSRELRQALIVAMRSARCTRRGAHQTRRAQSRAERTQQIAPGVAQMRRERIVKGILILVRDGLHLGEQERVAADRALTEQDQAACENVCAFHGNADRNLLETAPEEVARAEADALAAKYVHAGIERLARTLGD